MFTMKSAKLTVGINQQTGIQKWVNPNGINNGDGPGSASPAGLLSQILNDANKQGLPLIGSPWDEYPSLICVGYDLDELEGDAAKTGQIKVIVQYSQSPFIWQEWMTQSLTQQTMVQMGWRPQDNLRQIEWRPIAANAMPLVVSPVPIDGQEGNVYAYQAGRVLLNAPKMAPYMMVTRKIFVPYNNEIMPALQTMTGKTNEAPWTPRMGDVAQSPVAVANLFGQYSLQQDQWLCVECSVQPSLGGAAYIGNPDRQVAQVNLTLIRASPDDRNGWRFAGYLKNPRTDQIAVPGELMQNRLTGNLFVDGANPDAPLTVNAAIYTRFGPQVGEFINGTGYPLVPLQPF